MKYCKNCGAENNDENVFCFNCRHENFDTAPAQPVPPVQPVSPIPPVPNGAFPPPMQFIQPPRPKKTLGIFELLTILGFVSSIVGMFSISMILHPLGAVTSIIGFVQGKRFRALAIAGTVISIVGGIVYTVISLYRNGLLPEWITFGAFH